MCIRDRAYAARYPALAAARLDALRAALRDDRADDFLPLLGQELEALGLALIGQDEDDDGIHLLIVPQADASDTLAVSYTHLDVYKRQVYSNAGLMTDASSCAAKPGYANTMPRSTSSRSSPANPRLNSGVRRCACACLLYTSRCV